MKQTVPVEEAKAGDIIFFDWPDDNIVRAQHVGIVTGWKAGKICTVEGNTVNGSAKSCVARKIRATSLVTGIGRPNYPKGVLDMLEKDVVKLIQDTVKELLEQQEKVRREKQVDAWAKESWEAAIQAGLTDGTRPCDTATRQEVILMLQKAKGG